MAKAKDVPSPPRGLPARVVVPRRLYNYLTGLATWVETMPECVTSDIERALDDVCNEYYEVLKPYVPEGIEVFDVETGRAGTLWVILEDTAGLERRVRIKIK